MPLLPPVMSAIFPSSLPMGSLLGSQFLLLFAAAERGWRSDSLPFIGHKSAAAGGGSGPLIDFVRALEAATLRQGPLTAGRSRVAAVIGPRVFIALLLVPCGTALCLPSCGRKHQQPVRAELSRSSDEYSPRR